MCPPGCYKTTSWKGFLMMLHGTYQTSCPCEFYSNHCYSTSSTIKHILATHSLGSNRKTLESHCHREYTLLPAAVVLNSVVYRLTVGSVQLMVASGSHEGNSRHCRPGRASPMSCETTPFSISSPSSSSAPLLRSSPTTHTAIPLANESVWWLNCLICGVSACMHVCVVTPLPPTVLFHLL